MTQSSKLSLSLSNVLSDAVTLEVGEEEGEQDQDGHGEADQDHQHQVGVV